MIPKTFRTALALCALLIGGAAFGAGQSAAFIGDLTIDGTAQTVHVDLTADVGFPDGKRTAIAELKCNAKTPLRLRGVEDDGRYGIYRPTPVEDPQAIALLQAAEVLSALPNGQGMSVRSQEGLLSFQCVPIGGKNVLVSDFSDFTVSAQRNLNRTIAFASLSIAHTLPMGPVPVILTVPVMSAVSAEGDRITQTLTLHLDSSQILSASKISSLTLDHYAREPWGSREGFFYYDETTRVLTQLRYENNDTGVDRFKNVNIPKNSVLIFYYAPDFRTPTGWQRTTVNLMGRTYTESVNRPANSNFAR